MPTLEELFKQYKTARDEFSKAENQDEKADAYMDAVECLRALCKEILLNNLPRGLQDRAASVRPPDEGVVYLSGVHLPRESAALLDALDYYLQKSESITTANQCRKSNQDKSVKLETYTYRQFCEKVLGEKPKKNELDAFNKRLKYSPFWENEIKPHGDGVRTRRIQCKASFIEKYYKYIRSK